MKSIASRVSAMALAITALAPMTAQATPSQNLLAAIRAANPTTAQPAKTTIKVPITLDLRTLNAKKTANIKPGAGAMPNNSTPATNLLVVTRAKSPMPYMNYTDLSKAVNLSFDTADKKQGGHHIKYLIMGIVDQKDQVGGNYYIYQEKDGKITGYEEYKYGKLIQFPKNGPKYSEKTEYTSNNQTIKYYALVNKRGIVNIYASINGKSKIINRIKGNKEEIRYMPGHHIDYIPLKNIEKVFTFLVENYNSCAAGVWRCPIFAAPFAHMYQIDTVYTKVVKNYVIDVNGKIYAALSPVGNHSTYEWCLVGWIYQSAKIKEYPWFISGRLGDSPPLLTNGQSLTLDDAFLKVNGKYIQSLN